MNTLLDLYENRTKPRKRKKTQNENNRPTSRSYELWILLIIVSVLEPTNGLIRIRIIKGKVLLSIWEAHSRKILNFKFKN